MIQLLLHINIELTYYHYDKNVKLERKLVHVIRTFS